VFDDPSWTEEERRIKKPFLSFWIPVVFFLAVWVFSMAFLDFLRWMRG
jgi:hypothetical protein